VPLIGLDLVLEGTARVVTDEPTLQRLAKIYNSQGWPARVSEGAFTAPFSAPSAGPPPWNLWVMTPSAAIGLSTVEPGGATRWRFYMADPEIPGIRLRRLEPSDAQAIGAAFDAAVRVGWTYLRELASRPMRSAAERGSGGA